MDGLPSTEGVYPDLEPFWADLRRRTPSRSAALAALGCTYLQLDDTSLAYLNDPSQRAHLAARWRRTPSTSTSSYIRTINAAIADRPEGMRVTTHMCRGNYRSSWVAEGGYDYVAEALFSELAVDGFFLRVRRRAVRRVRAAALRAPRASRWCSDW